MNYIKLSLTHTPSLTLYDTNEGIVASHPLVSEKETAVAKVTAADIKGLNWSYEGILVVGKESELGDQELARFKTLEEELNCPVVFNSDVGDQELSMAFKDRVDKVTWSLDYFGYQPGKKEYSVESLLTVGNGYLGLRGTTPEMAISDDHYPAAYIAGHYNEAVSVVEGKEITNEDFVNSANLQFMTLRFSDGEILEITKDVIRSLKRHLDLRSGLFSSALEVAVNGRELRITTKRVVNMADKHHYSLQYQVTPLNFSEEVTLIAKSDGEVYNYNTERYRQLNQEHLDLVDLRADGCRTQVTTVTKQSAIQVIQQSELVVPDSLTIANHLTNKAVIQEVPFMAKEGQTTAFEKNITVSSYLQGEHVSVSEQRESGVQPQSFEKNYAESQNMWHDIWEKMDIQISGDMMSQKLLRLHAYHLLVSGSPIANDSLDVSITARGLHGEAYRGHIFWDEIFILPFYQLHFPDLARQLLMYRYNRLAQAKENAVAEGYTGAMYPWQSSLDGTEQSQVIHLNPLNGEWDEDYSRLQRHVSLAIAYNILSYRNNTTDKAFMLDYGNEMLLEIAEFWRGKAVWSSEKSGYSIPNVMGPDEFHEAYSDSAEGGLTNNAYTNIMVAWLFKEMANIASELTERQQTELLKKVGLKADVFTELTKISQELIIPINEEGIIAQFEGYFDLEEIDWEGYKETYGNIYRMDRILSAEGKSADDYKVAKQADTLMTFYNLSLSEVTTILEGLNYQLPTDYLERNYDYYIQRTSHGSTLSRIVHAQLADQVGKKAESWELYQAALRSDYADIQGGTTAEGIHTGVMAATLMVTLQTYGGLDTRGETLSFTPDLPEKWQEMSFNFSRNDIHYQVTLTHQKFELCASEATDIIFLGKVCHVEKNQRLRLDYGNEG